MFYVTIAIITILFIFNTYLSYLNYAYRHHPIPETVADVYNEEDYKAWLDYTMDVHRFSTIRRITGTLLLLGLLFAGFFPWLASLAEGVMAGVIFQNLIFLGAYGGVYYLTNIGFSIYRTFVLEERYGFNRTTVGTFIMDQFRMLLMSALLGGGLVFVILHLYLALGSESLIYTWFIIMGFTLLINVLYTRVFIRLFNKLTPLPEGQLYEQCMELAQGQGYEIKKIQVMDASRRSTRLNAFFTGFGRFKSIILYDTLLEKCSNDEIVSVLAHEIGHGKHRDVLKNLILSAFQVAAYLATLGIFLTSRTLSESFGFDRVHYGFAMILFGIILEPVGMLLGIPLSHISRKAEYRADAFAASTGYGQGMVSALKVLARENFSNLTPHPLVVALTYSHPTIVQRIEALRRL